MTWPWIHIISFSMMKSASITAVISPTLRLLEITLSRHTHLTQTLRHSSHFITVLSALLVHLQITYKKTWLSWLSRAHLFNNFVFLSSLPRGYKFPVMRQFIKIMQYNATKSFIIHIIVLQNISFKYSIDKHSKLQSLILVCIAASLLTVSASIPGHEYEPLLWQHMQKRVSEFR